MPKITVGVIIEREGKILLTKRNVSPFHGYWVSPGGHIDENETAEEAARREIKEETGLDIRNIRFLFYCDEIFPEQKVHNISLVFHATADGSVQINDESTESGWFTPEEALKMKLGFKNSEVIRKWTENKDF